MSYGRRINGLETGAMTITRCNLRREIGNEIFGVSY